MAKKSLVKHYATIVDAARTTEDGQRCMVAPDPDLREKLKKELRALRGKKDSLAGQFLRAAEPTRLGLNDGLIIPPEDFIFGTPISRIRSAALERAPLAGVVRVIVVLVDFSDKPMTKTKAHFNNLFFSQGVIATKSVREYYTEVTNGIVDIQGSVVGPFRMPKKLSEYAHGASGIGAALPNAKTMARDAAVAANPSVNFGPFDNDGNGFVDAFIVIHAGSGAEQSGSSGDIWSHKWVLDGGAMNVDTKKIYAYLTVPEDCKIGVCAHELGHLLFGFPDLYDTDYSSEGIGNWCLMAGGSWGGGGNTPCHPSAWCKANQGWATVLNKISNSSVNVADVKDAHKVYRLWKNGVASKEYFLVENRQKKLFDSSLPSGGLLIWHIDENITSNSNEAHYKVALIQADGKKDLEDGDNRGDAGDPYPGSSNNTAFNNTSTPNSKSYANASTCVSVTGIPASAAIMTVNMGAKCLKFTKEIIPDKSKIEKQKKEFYVEKNYIIDKKLEKPTIDKSVSYDKGNIDKYVDKYTEGKYSEGGFGFGVGYSSPDLNNLEARLQAIESAMQQMTGGTGAEPFIGRELRPDLSGSALQGEDDAQGSLDEDCQGGAKRHMDSKPSEH